MRQRPSVLEDGCVNCRADSCTYRPAAVAPAVASPTGVPTQRAPAQPTRAPIQPTLAPAQVVATPTQAPGLPTAPATAATATSRPAASSTAPATAAPANPAATAAVAHPVPQELKAIPKEYYQAADQQGTLTDLYYDTYESFSYNQKSERLQKHAVVYLPYGYSKDKKYDIFYLMHGGGGDETGTLGTPNRPSSLKNTIDHAVAAGEMRPLIIVCPTYNNTNKNGRDSNNFSLAMQLTENYHNELINDLIPAVEGTYRTYAASIRKDDLIASRDHRGFGGFSMGSVATWRTFQYGLDYFRYFLPMSCGTSLNDEVILAAAEGHAPDDYFVFVMTGTNDFAYSYDKGRTDLMRASKYFSDVDGNVTGNFAFRVKEGYSHGGTAAMEYTYNGLVWFWH